MFGVIHSDLESFHLQRDRTGRSEVKSVLASLVQEWARTFSWGSSQASAVALKGLRLGEFPLLKRDAFC